MISSPIIIFDDHCLLCNTSVKFILKHDTKRRFFFTNIQSSTAKQIRHQFKLEHLKDDTIILIDNNRFYIKSDAILEIIKSFHGLWRFILISKLLPKTIRDFIYDLVARHRYLFIRKENTCLLPSQDEKGRFIDD